MLWILLPISVVALVSSGARTLLGRRGGSQSSELGPNCLSQPSVLAETGDAELQTRTDNIPGWNRAAEATRQLLRSYDDLRQRVAERTDELHKEIAHGKQSKVDLQQAERQLEISLGLAGVAAWTWSPSEDVLVWSGPTHELFGRTASELQSFAAFQAIIFEQDLPQIRSKIELSLQTGCEYEAEFRIIMPDGQVRWIAALGGATFLDGQIQQLSGISIDITEKKLAEQDLAASAKRLRELADAMPQIVWSATPDGTLDYCNERWYSFSGFDRNLTGDQGWLPLLHPDDLGKCRDLWYESVHSGAPFAIECRFWDRFSHTHRWHLCQALATTDTERRIVKWFGTFTDVDDYKRAEQEIIRLNEDLERRVEERTAALAKSEEGFRYLIEGVKDYSILMLDVKGNVQSWNSGAERISGYTAEEIVGKHFSLFYTPEDRMLGRPANALRLAEENGSLEQEAWRIDKHGAKFWAYVVLTALRTADGTLRGFSKVTRDISERKRVEELVTERNTQLGNANVALSKQTQRAEEANRAKSEFLAAMSHEVRTPMNAILGMADLLWETELDPTQRQYVGVFRRAGANLLTLVNDILDLSKIESGHFELEQIDFDLEDLVERTIDIIRPKSEAKHVALIAHVAPGIPPYLAGDPTRLQQILINLLGNAVKFTEQGEVTLRVTGSEAGRVYFEVSDTGIGIHADKLQCIFDDFTQAETSTTRRFGGTGLGLGICRRLVSRMGGELKVTSEVGKGSCFSFDVSFAASKRLKRRRPEMSDGIVGRRVLIVDNNATNRLIFAQMCSAWGMQVSECSVAQNVLTALRSAASANQGFELMILDRLMPAIDGFRLVAEVREALPALPVIMATSDNLPGDETRSREMGLAGYMVKPVRRADLLRAICGALGANLPTTPFESEDVPAERIASVSEGSILIAEDSEDNRFLLQAYLKNAPYEITFVENGERAVESARSKAYDLILMDMQMPLMDGLTATTLIRRAEQANGDDPVPVLALTANARREDIDACIEAGCTSHLAKPISKAKLLGVIEEYLSKAKPPFSSALVIHVPPGFEAAARRYIQSRKDEVPSLLQLASDKKFDELRVLAHNIKGAGTSYGFPDLTELGGMIEISATERDSVSLSRQLAHLAEYVKEASNIVAAITP